MTSELAHMTCIDICNYVFYIDMISERFMIQYWLNNKIQIKPATRRCPAIQTRVFACVRAYVRTRVCLRVCVCVRLWILNSIPGGSRTT